MAINNTYSRDTIRFITGTSLLQAPGSARSKPRVPNVNAAIAGTSWPEPTSAAISRTSASHIYPSVLARGHYRDDAADVRDGVNGLIPTCPDCSTTPLMVPP